MGNKPRIRFKGFTEDWEQRKLGDLTQLITKGTTPKVKNIQNGINFIKVENISDDGVISINSYVSEEEHMNYLSRSILSNDDILFSIAGTLGRTAIVKSHLLPANTNQALAIIRLNKSVDVEYINTFLKSNAIKTYIRKNPTVGAQPNLSLGQVSDLEINIPSYSEQKKISNLFSNFDLMITLHQCKLEKLKLTKKALLQKLFPKNGKDIPEIRFKGFIDAWEQRKLGDLTQLITKGTTPKVKNIQNGINFIKVENISDDGVISINSYVSEEEHMNYLSRSILSNDDILFSIAGTLGRTAIVKSHLLPANTNQALAIIRLNKSVDVEYINTFLKSNAIKTYIRKNPTVGAQPNLSLGQVSDLEINIPSYSEQKKISNLFSNFDLMITLHQRKLERLQEVKKGLLQKMFV